LAKIAAEPFAAKVEELSHVLDKRNYRVNFDKFHRHLGFKAEELPKQGVDEMTSALRLRLVSADDQRYSNPLGIQWTKIPTVAAKNQ
jgi:hypothetical protein